MSTVTLPVTGPEQIAVPRTASVLSALITLTRRDGRPPTIDQLKMQAGIRSTKVLYQELKRLEERGLLVHKQGCRGLVLCAATYAALARDGPGCDVHTADEAE
jgi:hypothetical protein